MNRKFSLLLPTRGRPKLLVECLKSFYSRAGCPDRVEALLACDFDDPTEAEISSFLKEFGQDVKVLKRQRSVFHQAHYNNELARIARGDYLWTINDDCEMITQGWDGILESWIEKFIPSDRILYVGMDDSTHTEEPDSKTIAAHPQWKGRNIAQEWGCCFPIITREAYRQLGFFFPPEIHMWGADVILYKIFQCLPDRVLRIPNVKILHKSFHIGTRLKDGINEEVDQSSKCRHLTESQIRFYGEKLNSEIRKMADLNKTSGSETKIRDGRKEDWNRDGEIELSPEDQEVLRRVKEAYQKKIRNALPCLEKLSPVLSQNGIMEAIRSDILAGRYFSLREKILKLIENTSSVARRTWLDLALALEDEILAQSIAAKEIAWKSPQDQREVSRGIKQLRAAHYSDHRWLPPWPEGRQPIGLRWDGPFFVQSGYAWGARSYIQAAESAHLPVQVRHMVYYESYTQNLSAEEMTVWKKRYHQPIDPDVYIATAIPVTFEGIRHFFRFRRLNPGFDRYIGFTTFETDRVPSPWIADMRTMDEIWVHSEFNRRVFEEALGTHPRVRSLPLAINPVLYENLPHHSSIPRDQFVFLSVFELSSRKGWDLLLKAWTRAFSSRDPVLLHIHTLSRQIKNPVSLIKEYLHKSSASHQHAPVQVSCLPFSDAEMRSLYASCSAFVLPSRGEGWGIPFMEAMCCGKPVIGPAEGGQADFMNSENSWLLPGRWEIIPEKVLWENRLPLPFFEGHRWFCCQEDALVEQMREVFKGRSMVGEKASRGKEEISRKFSMKAVGAQLKQLLENQGKK